MKKDKRIQAQISEEQYEKVIKVSKSIFGEENTSLAIRYIINKHKINEAINGELSKALKK